VSSAPTTRALDISSSASALIAAELVGVEERIDELLRSREKLLTEIAAYLVHSGGKRVRPAVTLLAFRACGGEDVGPVIDAAAALEMIHSATLLHDDIIDGSDTRRGKMSARRKFGVGHTLVTGDFLFSRAFQICAQFDKTLINWAAEACISLTEGEILQGRFRHNPAVTVADYMEIISRKTASLFSTGGRAGAYLARKEGPHIEALSDCGFHIGLAFQIIDDLLDVEGSEARVGKPVGIDLREGNPSLPLVLAAQRDPEVRRVFEDPNPPEPEIAGALLRIRRSGIPNEVRALAIDHAERARQALLRLEDTEYRSHLLTIIDQLVERPS
jgi:octaprenyl-diphosphate synthase